ncbi:alpha-amylase [Flexibacter flexilis DSM 6793]|uniref:Alpha-amylase n=1 Tax=Flexibacter flexilis DSM 6793 TaxID=927664 RepID=A0A1I1EA99_9BACT|nr:glycoside hydrolase family 57 protein [Flexibacter flexilis]SFB82278.1 alpha-amylase [Flexibacter flexilis DSM 6793]
MASVCLYFQVHQPFRLRDYSFMNIGHNHHYEAADQNYHYLQRVAEKSYLPANALLLKLIKQFEGKFKVSFSISGICLEQMEKYAPAVLHSFKQLVATGCVELFGETYYHSLAGLYSDTEFERQVLLHKKILKRLFNYTPTTFRNTELIYNDRIASMAANLGFTTVVTEDARRILGANPSIKLYQSAEKEAFVLLRNSQLSDDIAFRFTEKSWAEYPLTADKFAGWLHRQAAFADTIGLFMDYETFGEHRAAETGIFDFLETLPAAVIGNRDFKFRTPAEAVKIHKPYGIFSVKESETISWADENRDLAAWTAGLMQQDCLRQLYALEHQLAHVGNSELWDEWGKLQTSDHFYYMSTRYWGNPVHDNFSPYASPYDAYINYMNILSDFEIRLQTAPVYEAY